MVKGGRLIGHAKTANDIVAAMVALGPAGRGATMWYEAHPHEVTRWAVMDVDGHIGSNCYFDTEEQARGWLKSWARIAPHGVVVTRVGQHHPWLPAPLHVEDGNGGDR